MRCERPRGRVREIVVPKRPPPARAGPGDYDHAVSYDILFLSRRYGQSWDDALKALEDAAEADEGDEAIPGHLLDAWQRIVPQARDLLGEVEIDDEGSTERALSHDGTGIELYVYGGEVGVTVPYWHTGEGAESVIGRIAALAAVVEKETGLTAYDPQSGHPLDEAPEHAARTMAGVTDDLRRRYGG